MVMLADAEKQASILLEALPYVKYGGAAMINDDIKKNVIEDIGLLSKSVCMRPEGRGFRTKSAFHKAGCRAVPHTGYRIVLVHGGGPEIETYLSRLNIKSEFADGLRVTDDETMNVVQMVLCGRVNKNIVALLQSAGVNAAGLSGIDCALLAARVLEPGVLENNALEPRVLAPAI